MVAGFAALSPTVLFFDPADPFRLQQAYSQLVPVEHLVAGGCAGTESSSYSMVSDSGCFVPFASLNARQASLLVGPCAILKRL